jgi:hypothetical protein
MLLSRSMERSVLLTESAKIVASKQQVSSNLGDEKAILSLNDGVYYGLNSVGARIWNLIQQPRTFAELHTILIDEFDVDGERLESDLRHVLDQLTEQQLVEISG